MDFASFPIVDAVFLALLGIVLLIISYLFTVHIDKTPGYELTLRIFGFVFAAGVTGAIGCFALLPALMLLLSRIS